MTAGRDLRRADGPIPELEDFMRVVACAAALVKTAGPLAPEVAAADADLLRRLAAALARVGIGDDGAVTSGDEERDG